MKLQVVKKKFYVCFLKLFLVLWIQSSYVMTSTFISMKMYNDIQKETYFTASSYVVTLALIDPHWRHGRTWQGPCRDCLGSLCAHVRPRRIPRHDWITFRDEPWSWLSSLFEKLGQKLRKFGLFPLIQASLLLQICKGGGNSVYIKILYNDTEKCGDSQETLVKPKFKQITEVFVLLTKIFKSNLFFDNLR